MSIITAVSPNTTELLTARVAQTRAILDHQFETMNAGNTADWDDVYAMKTDLVSATFAQQQHFTIQHHLAKTILSST